ncbi:MAG TPA: N-acetylmuramoyl-L-alanine amidase [Bradyrhizobium sp.]
MIFFASTAKKAAGPIAWLLTALVAFSLVLQVRPALAASCASKAPENIAIALDVGHTATNFGATSARGIREYDFNIKLAQRVKEELLSAGFRSTSLMVTELNGYSGLNQRPYRANRMNADIFISIHHDSVRDKYLIPWLDEGKQHYFFDESKGFSLHVSPRYAESLRLARILADQLIESGLQFTTIHELKNPEGARVPYLDSTRGIYRRDNLVVLKQTKMPAVLLEAGVIVNRVEELVVSTPAYQAIIATAITEAVRKFCNPNEPPTYRVVKVAPPDVLNIRSGPDADLSIVGTIPPDGRGVRIVGACSGQWCEVDYRGARGWVSRQFLDTE